jgi:glycylpeptide N-tetradecanoyltransferase
MKNYVEDSSNVFRFAYPVEFLRWALLVPEYMQSWHLGVRSKDKGKLVAFISGTPVNMKVEGNDLKMAEINFLCVHKKIRTKRLAPLLIQEVTRRINLKNIWQAVYTAGVVVPTPVANTVYFHRNLNPKKLVEVGFTDLP